MGFSCKEGTREEEEREGKNGWGESCQRGEGQKRPKRAEIDVLFSQRELLAKGPRRRGWEE